MTGSEICIFWFRRDLRLDDNAGLYRALKSGYPVLPVFIFDWNILQRLSDRADQRVHFIWQEVNRLKKELETDYGSSLKVIYARPLHAMAQLAREYNVAEVVTNRDYEPYARERDKAVYEFWQERGVSFRGFKDQVLLEKSEVVKDNGAPYTVFTPYMKKYRQRLRQEDLRFWEVSAVAEHFARIQPLDMPELHEMGFRAEPFDFPAREMDREVIRNYHRTRDIPALKGTTRLSLHLRFGTISLRQLARVAMAENDKFFNELIWRDFYQMILYHFPHSAERSFRPEYDRIAWENNEEHFARWKQGTTGYPLVDAGMRELAQTGYMHNRVRMLVASFLTKHLLIDWRWGEAWFAEKLLDYEMASNVGGWQWAAGSGVDAAPYFRIFNPELQRQKFDPDFTYVKKWVPEYATEAYPEPVVEHKAARQRALDRYRGVLQ